MQHAALSAREAPSPAVPGPGRHWACACSHCTLLSLEKGCDRAKVFTVRLMITVHLKQSLSDFLNLLETISISQAPTEAMELC